MSTNRLRPSEWRRYLSLATVVLLVAVTLWTGGANGATPQQISRTVPDSTCQNVTPWGDQLRSCYVAPPAVPSLAPDGARYGAVQSGYTGTVGPSAFSPGIPTVVGTPWNTSAGQATRVNSNTFWGNESSIPLAGNVTVAPGKTLTIYDSGVTWTEPSTATNYAYGFNVTSKMPQEKAFCSSANNASGQVSTLNCTIGAHAGDALVLVSANQGGRTISTVVDAQSNSFVTRGKFTNPSDTNSIMETWYATAASTGNDKVTVTYSSTTYYLAISIFDIANATGPNTGNFATDDSRSSTSFTLHFNASNAGALMLTPIVSFPNAVANETPTNNLGYRMVNSFGNQGNAKYVIQMTTGFGLAGRQPAYPFIRNYTINVHQPSFPLEFDGFTMEFDAANNPGGRLVVTQGTNITQASPAGKREWFIAAENLYYNVSVTNSTLNTPSFSTPTGGVPSWNASTVYDRGLDVSWFSYSKYVGYGDTAYLGSLNVTGCASHSVFVAGAFAGNDCGNNSFMSSAISLLGSVPFGDSGGVGRLLLNYTTVTNIGISSQAVNITEVAQPGLAFNTQGDAYYQLGVAQEFITHSSFTNWNGTYLGTYYFGTHYHGLTYYGAGNEGPYGKYVIANDTVTNAWTWRLSGVDLLGTDNNGGDYQAAVDLPLGIVDHNTITDCNVYGNLTLHGGLNIVHSVGDTSVEYNDVKGWYTHEDLTESGPFTIDGFNFNLSYNLFQNFIAPTLTPLNTHQMFDGQDQNTQIYNEAVGYANASMHMTCLTQQDCNSSFVGPSNVGHYVLDNWFVNTTGQTWMVQLIGGRVKAIGNTMVNLTTGGGIGVSVDSSVTGAYVANNTCYGVYNYSMCIGSNEGGANNTNYYGNAAYDVDATAWSMWTETSKESWTAENFAGASLILINTNATSGGVPIGRGNYQRITSIVNLNGDSLQYIQLYGRIPTSNITLRTPLPTDFNITLNNTYVPGSFTQQAYSILQAHPGSAWSASKHTNPSFLNLTGYLGGYAGENYTVNTSNIRGESSLQVVFGGIQGLVLPQTVSASGWIYQFSQPAPLSVAISVNSSRAPIATVSIPCPPGPAALYLTNWSTGAPVSTVGVYVPQNGLFSTTFFPGNESGGVIFTLVSEAGFGSPGHVNLAPIILLVIVATVASVIVYIGVKRERSRPWAG